MHPTTPRSRVSARGATSMAAHYASWGAGAAAGGPFGNGFCPAAPPAPAARPVPGFAALDLRRASPPPPPNKTTRSAHRVCLTRRVVRSAGPGPVRRTPPHCDCPRVLLPIPLCGGGRAGEACPAPAPPPPVLRGRAGALYASRSLPRRNGAAECRAVGRVWYDRAPAPSAALSNGLLRCSWPSGVALQ